MDRQEQRPDGAKSGPEPIRKDSLKILVRATAVVLILTGIGLILLAIAGLTTTGWGGEDVPSGLLIALALVLSTIAIAMLVSSGKREEQS